MSSRALIELGDVVVDDRPCRAWHASRRRLRWLGVRVHVVVVATGEPLNPAAAPLFAAACLAHARRARPGWLARVHASLAVVAAFPVTAVDERLRQVLARPTQEAVGTWLIPVAITPDGAHHTPPRLAQNGWLVEPYVRGVVDAWAREHARPTASP
ncbi:MAG: hypothetical protein R3C15_22350 [Thermoleophilia bacterium]